MRNYHKVSGLKHRILLPSLPIEAFLPISFILACSFTFLLMMLFTWNCGLLNTQRHKNCWDCYFPGWSWSRMKLMLLVVERAPSPSKVLLACLIPSHLHGEHSPCSSSTRLWIRMSRGGESGTWAPAQWKHLKIFWKCRIEVINILDFRKGSIGSLNLSHFSCS